ncbi:MAG: HAD-IIA family hydrolase, partial [Chloroflexota bacterium]|nr:HAD-IIA family hydrolase [Chloroflexota bacterium]
MLSFDVSQLRGLILDMDGVIWKKYQPLGDLRAIFERIANNGWDVLLATNNSTQTKAHYLESLAKFGVVLSPWQIVNSALAAAQYLREIHPQGGRVQIVGEDGLHQALAKEGFHHASSNKEGILAVVAGLDFTMTYQKIDHAAKLIRAGASFIATNPDKTYPTPQGLAPGAGTIIAALEAASGMKAKVIGKPQSDMYQLALKRLGALPEETLVIGDRLETDIAGAQNTGCYSALVLSGVASLEEAQNWCPAPDII